MNAASINSFTELAGKYLRKQAGALASQVAGCRVAEDAERVHQARVASRRLREGIRIFRPALPPKKAARWARTLRRVTRGLGAARDADVQIEFVRGLLRDLDDPTRRPGLARLLLRLAQCRCGLQQQVGRGMDRLDDSGILAEIRAAGRKVFRKASVQPAGSGGKRLGKSRRYIRARLGALLDRQGALKDPDGKDDHHQMRIDAKHLRYAMEICGPLYAGRLDRFVRLAKRLQGLLGDLHDTDVWIDLLGQFIPAERLRTAEYFGSDEAFGELAVGLEYMLANCRDRRERQFANLVRVWDRLVRRNVWGELAKALALAPVELDPPTG